MPDLNPAQFADYRMAHRPASPSDDVGAPFHRADEVMPDVTGPKGTQFYGHRDFAEQETFRQLRAAKGNPDAPVTIYRAAPEGSGIHSGDWVTPSRAYAERHRESNGQPDWEISSRGARASQIWGHGDSPHEWGFHAEGG